MLVFGDGGSRDRPKNGFPAGKYNLGKKIVRGTKFNFKSSDSAL